MEKVIIHTTQNVGIEYELAGVGNRIISNFIDYLIIAGYWVCIALLFISDLMEPEWYFLVLFSIPPLLYQLLCELFLNGQSFGMKVRKTRVIRLDGKQLTLGNCMLRWVIRIIDISISGGSVAIVTIVTSDKGQRLGDLAAGTTVVSLRSETKMSETILSDFDPNHAVTYPLVNKLNDQDIAILKESLINYQITSNKKPLIALSEKLKGILEISAETKLESEQFLKEVIKDYNAVTGTI